MEYQCKGFYLFEGIRTIDYFSRRKEVDANRIGATGVSLGGEISLFVSAIDERIKCCVMSCFLTCYKQLSNGRNCPCFWIPGILKYANMGDIGALIAPRAVNYQIGLYDRDFTPHAAQQEFRIIQKAYKVYGADKNAKLSILKGKHEYYLENAVSWFKEHL